MTVSEISISYHSVTTPEPRPSGIANASGDTGGGGLWAVGLVFAGAGDPAPCSLAGRWWSPARARPGGLFVGGAYRPLGAVALGCCGLALRGLQFRSAGAGSAGTRRLSYISAALVARTWDCTAARAPDLSAPTKHASATGAPVSVAVSIAFPEAPEARPGWLKGASSPPYK